MKILHAPTSVGGNCWGLSQGEKTIGLHSTVMYYQNSWLNYPCDINLNLSQCPRTRILFRKALFFTRALKEYDIFHFNFGTSLLSFPRLNVCDIELPIYKTFRKKIIVTYNGCDARQKDYCISHFSINACSEPDCYEGHCNEKTDALKRRRIKHFANYANKVLTVNPDLLYVLPNAEFIPYTIPGFHKLISSPITRNNDEKIKILHAPTDRGAKGTKHILETLDKIKLEYRNVKVVLLENIPNNKAREIYKEVNLVIDQVLIGWYGGLAVEAMALGKPVVCYIRGEDLKFIPPEMKKDMPIINANPGNLYEVLKKVIEERDRLLSLGEKSREYVKKWHDPVKIAMRMKKIYESL